MLIEEEPHGATKTIGHDCSVLFGARSFPVPELLNTLKIEGSIVTLVAIHCQTETVETIVDKGAEYVPPVKENLSRLLENLQGIFDDPAEMRWVDCDCHKTEEQGYGRVGIRECWSTSDPEYLGYIATLVEWRGLQSIATVQAERQLGDPSTVTRRYFISSLTGDAKLLLQTVRGHWGCCHGETLRRWTPLHSKAHRHSRKRTTTARDLSETRRQEASPRPH